MTPIFHPYKSQSEADEEPHTVFFRGIFYREGQIKQLIKCTHVRQDIHLFCVLHSTPLQCLDPQALSGWQPKTHVPPERMWMSWLGLSQQLRLLSAHTHLWLPLMQVWFWFLARDKGMTSGHEFMSTQDRVVNLCLQGRPAYIRPAADILRSISWDFSEHYNIFLISPFPSFVSLYNIYINMVEVVQEAVLVAAEEVMCISSRHRLYIKGGRYDSCLKVKPSIMIATCGNKSHLLHVGGSDMTTLNFSFFFPHLMYFLSHWSVQYSSKIVFI